jgi:hypothetical protein
MTKIYIVPIEPINTRYTRQWYTHIPESLEKMAKDRKMEIDIVVVDGEQVPPVPSPGAFLDFGATNIYKSSQLATIAEEFQHARVKPGDTFLFTDAWNPTVISVKYMSELLNIPVEIHGMWHAGSYDPQDFLGRLIGDKPWVRNAEKSMFECYDTNWFATHFHSNLFLRELLGMENIFSQDETEEFIVGCPHSEINRLKLTGWPMDYLFDVLGPYATLEKKQQICFPHRIAPEKQLEIFKDLAATMPEFEWIVCQERELTKHEYHTILGESKMVFSANLQETYGISCIEGLICGAIPLVPDRLSYSEMYDVPFKYPSEWTKNWESYQANKPSLVAFIRDLMASYPTGQNIGNNSTANDIAKHIKILDGYVRAIPLFESLLAAD